MKKSKTQPKPEGITYKGLTFKARHNVLGVASELLSLQDKLEEEEYINTLWIVGLKEYAAYKEAIRERVLYEQDLANAQKELTLAKKKKDKEAVKQWQGVVDADSKAIAENEKILNRPDLSNAAELYHNKLKSIRVIFTTNRENIKVLCAGLLEGDLNGIDFNDNSDEFWTFVMSVWVIFFSIMQKTKSTLPV